MAIEQFERSMRLSPFDPLTYVCMLGIGSAHFVAGRYEEAISWSNKVINEHPSATWALRVLVPALVHADRKHDAQRALVRLLESYPTLSVQKVVDALPFGPSTMQRIIAGLREAGLPE